MSIKLKEYIPEVLIVLCTATLLSIYPDKVTGLHYDEALTILKSWMIDKGLRPLNGMVPYIGAIFHYLMWPLFEVFGYKIEVMRLTSAAFNTLSVILAMILFKHFYPESKKHRYAGMLLCTLPAFVILTRFAAEIQALNLFLTLTGFLFIAKSVRLYSGKNPILGALVAGAGGFFIGLVVYNHIIGITIPAALLLSTVIVYRFNPFKKLLVWFMGVGFSGGIGVRIYQFLFTEEISKWSEKASESSLMTLLMDLPNLPFILNDTLNGELLYQRHVGDVAFKVIPYITIATFLIIIFRLLLLRKTGFSDVEKLMTLFVLFVILFIILISSNFTPHYFLIPLYMYPLLLTAIATPLLNRMEGYAGRLGHVILTSVIVLNLFYLSINYFRTFLNTGGSLSIFNIGNRLSETSNGWVRFDRLYNELKERGVQMVVSDLSIVTPLKVYDLSSAKINTFVYRQLNDIQGLLTQKSAIIFYNSVNLVRKKEVIPPGDAMFIHGEITYERDNSYDPHFAVFVGEP